MPELRVLVTGARGFVGRTVIERLSLAWPESRVVGADRLESVDGSGVVCDLTDLAATTDLVMATRPNIVFHCAGAVGGNDVAQLAEALLTPTRTLVAALSAHAPDVVLVVPGSAAEYGPMPIGARCFVEGDAPAPVSPYGFAKAAQTAVVLDGARVGLDARVGRIFNLIGPGTPEAFLAGRVAASLVAMASGRADAVLALGPLDGVRDFLDVRDACDALLAIARSRRPGGVYNVCTGTGRTGHDLVGAFLAVSGMKARVETSGTGSSRPGIDASVGDPSLISRECGWQTTTPFLQSVRDTYESAMLAAQG